MVEVLHHYHRRKRIYKGHEPYPHPDKWKRWMDKAIYAVGILGPVMTIPQVTSIWIGKNAAGVSVTSWASYLVLGMFWVAYGIMHREKPIIVTYTGWILLDAAVVLGALIYG